MADINKTYSSDSLASHVVIDLRKRGASDYYAEVQIAFDGGKEVVTKEVNLDELTAGEKADLVAGAQALFAAALAKVTAGDF